MPETIRNKHTHIPWKKIKGMRNLLSHEYFGVDPGIIWKTIQEDIPTLRNDLETILDNNQQ